MKKFFLIFFSFNILFINNIIAKQDTLSIYYNINESELNQLNISKIKAFIKSTENIEKIEINAYADYLASNDYNSVLTEKRAANVKFFIENYTFKKIKCIAGGMGEILPEIPDSKEGVPQNRRADIIVFTKDLNNTSPQKITDLKVGEKIILKNMNFLPGRHYLTPESQPELENLLNTLSENPQLKIEIQGHICCETGGNDGMDKDTYTNNLSVNRAKYIYDYLIKNQIDATRLSYKGLGSAKPLIYPEITEKDQNQNRRVEIIVTQK